jgi:hypothetical protein
LERLSNLERYHNHELVTSFGATGYPSLPLDCRLLSHPRLHALRIKVDNDIFDRRLVDEDIQNLEHVLTEARNLRVLEIIGKNMDSAVFEVSLRTSQTPLLQLEELDIRTLPVYFTAQHSPNIVHWVDWTTMRRLHLGDCSTATLFKAITGLVPGLEVITFHWDPPYNCIQFCREEAFQIMHQFFEKIQGLKEVIIHYRQDQIAAFWKLWRAILQRSGSTLQSLSFLFSWYVGQAEYIDEETLSDLPRYAPGIVELAMNCRAEWIEDNLHSDQVSFYILPSNQKSSKTHWLLIHRCQILSTPAMSALLALTRLRKLSLHLRVHHNVYDAEKMQIMAQNVFQSFLKHNPYCALEELSIHYKYTYRHAEWVFRGFKTCPLSKDGSNFRFDDAVIVGDSVTQYGYDLGD